MREVPHHFINFLSVTKDYNAGIYEKDALGFLESYFLKNRTALLVGGSGLYVQALCDGMDKVPSADRHIREILLHELNNNGLEALVNRLKILDESYYAEVDKKNPHRVLRALEVCLISGKPYSSFRHKFKGTERNFNVIRIGLELPRDVLYEKINQRVDAMIEKGLVEEAEQLLLYRECNALQSVGYEELFDYFDNKITLPKAIELIKRNTRRYAKRQMTWFKKDKRIKWFSPEKKEDILEYIQNKVRISR